VAGALPVSSVMDVVIFYSPLAVFTAVITSITPVGPKRKQNLHEENQAIKGRCGPDLLPR